MKRIISLSDKSQISLQTGFNSVSYVAQSDTMLELAICCGVRCRSALIVCVNCGKKGQWSRNGMNMSFIKFDSPVEGTCTTPRKRS